MKLKQIRVDGYKNLINCVVDLGDFNVLVGPNNSGKSNLLEAVQMLLPICFGDDKVRKGIFEGMTPRFGIDSSVCHLKKHENKAMTVGVVFEIEDENKLWAVDYEVAIQCDVSEKRNFGFLKESLKAKEVEDPLKKGGAKTYISRDASKEEKVFKVREFKKARLKEHAIAKDNPSLQAIRSLYPDFNGLPLELAAFVRAINWIALTKVFAISPKSLRNDINSEKPIDGVQISSFDLSLIVDNIKKEGKYYKLFVESLCDILDLEDVHFDVQDMPVPSEKDRVKETSKRVRLFFVKSTGNPFSWVEEYSDGTLVVTAILASLFARQVRGPVLCLEELENCLHPAAVEKLLRFLQDHSDKWPVLITTHSPYLLNGVKPEDVNVAVVDQTGGAHFEKVKNSKQLRDYLNKGLISFGDLLVKDFGGFRER